MHLNSWMDVIWRIKIRMFLRCTRCSRQKIYSWQDKDPFLPRFRVERLLPAVLEDEWGCMCSSRRYRQCLSLLVNIECYPIHYPHGRGKSCGTIEERRNNSCKENQGNPKKIKETQNLKVGGIVWRGVNASNGESFAKLVKGSETLVERTCGVLLGRKSDKSRKMWL